MGLKDKISNLFNSVSGNNSSSSVIGIDIGMSSIKVVQLKQSKGRVLLETYGAISLGPYVSQEIGKSVTLPPDVLTQAMKDLFKEANITTNKAAISVPFSSTLVKLIQVPKLSGAELKAMIPIEARKHIPVPLNEVMLDWFEIPQSSEQNGKEDKFESIDILLVAVHKEAIASLQNIANMMSISTDFYELEIFAAARSTTDYDIAPKLLIDFGASSTKMYIVEEGIVKFSHMLNFGSQNITENLSRAMSWNFEKSERVKKEIGISKQSSANAKPDEKQIYMQMHNSMLTVVDRVVNDMNKALLNYEQKFNKSITDVFIMGGGANLKGLIEHLETKLSVSAKKATPFDKVNTPAFLEDILKEIGVEFAIPVGLALRLLRQ